MAKYNPMFELRSSSEMKTLYKNPTVIVGFVALVLIIISCFVPFYVQGDGVAVKLEWLINSGFRDVILVCTIVTVILSIACLVFSIFFKNSTKLSTLCMILGGIILVLAIFELLYCTKIGFPNDMDKGTVVADFGLYYGSFAVLLASLLIVGNEFYKLGWQGYEVKEDISENSDNAEEGEQNSSEKIVAESESQKTEEDFDEVN